MMMIQNIDNHLKQLRLNARLTDVKETAKQLGITTPYLYKLEEYQAMPSIRLALKMKTLYKCTIDDIFKPYENVEL